VAPATALPVNAIDVVPPLQMLCVDGVATTVGIGFTVTTTVIGVPAQPAALTGVIVYVAVPGVSVVAVNACDIGPETGLPKLPEAVAPVTKF
jgi:hypothetical protein